MNMTTKKPRNFLRENLSMSNILQEYKKTLKNLEVEEKLDIFFYRPCAFLIIKTFYRLPLLPNHYSLFSFLSGLCAAYCFVQGESQSYLVGGLFFLLFAIFDCCDGMLARLKKINSDIGRYIDGMVDWSVNLLVYLALIYGLFKEFGFSGSFLSPCLLMAFCGLSKALHSFYYDYYLMRYLSHLHDKEQSFVGGVVELTSKSNKAWEKKQYFLYFFYVLSLVYEKGFALKAKKDTGLRSTEYCKKNVPLVLSWGIIGSSVHTSILVLSAFAANFNFYFIFGIIFGNIWFVIMCFKQRQVDKSLALASFEKQI